MGFIQDVQCGHGVGGGVQVLLEARTSLSEQSILICL